MPRLLRTSVALVAATVLMAGGRPSAGRLAERVALVTVVAESGTPIRDLTAKDFVVKEDGNKAEVLDAQLSKDPLSAALLLDAAQPPRGSAPRDLRAAASAFVTSIRAVNPDARIALWQFASAPIPTVDFTDSGVTLEIAISKLYPSQQTSAVLLDAVDAAAKQLAGRPGSRRALVTVDFNSPEASSDGMLQKAADSITNSGGTFWAVSVRAMGGMNPNREELLDRMTTASGGKRFSSVDATALEGMLKKVAASLTSQYVVTFARTTEKPVRSTTFETVRGPKVLPTPFMR
jgi:VWFA-related protein